ncbi:MAG: trigger factor [Streptococcaceae bacterium]|jgi:trigger factor|nr:trigger factor [Streptococcaceae bacterium]
MTVIFEKTSTNHGVLTFSIDQETIAKGLDQAFNRIKKQLNAPGFRKGHLPRKIFNRLYGEEALYEKALDIILPAAYDKAIKEAKLEPVTQPKVDVESIKKGEDWIIKADLVLKPKVKLGEYKGLKVRKKAAEVTDEDINQKIEKDRNDLLELSLKEDEAAAIGDLIVIDFDGSINGVSFKGSKGENRQLELGLGQFIPGFEDQLVGHKAGEKVNVRVSFPENYHAKDLAGKEALFVTKIHEIKSKRLPDLDDDFAKDVDDEVETLDELKAKYRKQLKKTKVENAKTQFEKDIVCKAVKNAEIIKLPEEMIHEEAHRLMNHFFNELKQNGIDQKTYLKITNTTKDDLYKKYEVEANKNVRMNLVLEAIIAVEKIGVIDEDVKKEMKELAQQYKMSVEKLKNVLPKETVEHDIKTKKAFDLIVASAIVKS